MCKQPVLVETARAAKRYAHTTHKRAFATSMQWHNQHYPVYWLHTAVSCKLLHCSVKTWQMQLCLTPLRQQIHNGTPRTPYCVHLPGSTSCSSCSIAAKGCLLLASWQALLKRQYQIQPGNVAGQDINMCVLPHTRRKQRSASSKVPAPRLLRTAAC
jgi:hypothetical protein